MANRLFNKGKQNLLDKKFDLNTDDIRLFAYDDSDDPINTSTDDALEDTAAGGRVATSNALDAPTITDGVFDADNEQLTGVSGDACDEVVIYLHTGVEATSLLLVFLHEGTNLPFTPNGGNVTVQWHGSGIFAL